MKLTLSAELPIIPAADEAHPSVIACREVLRLMEAEIERLTEVNRRCKMVNDERSMQNVELRAALKPFVGIYDRAKHLYCDNDLWPTTGGGFTFSVFKAARDAYQQPEPLVHVGADGEPHDGPRADCSRCR